MSNKGTGLELFVAEIEKVFAASPVNVTINRKLYLDSGTQLAEFDVEVEGKVGTSRVKLLLECRNRPSEGAAPVSWIEQLNTRRDVHGFDKVVAVSTTGFSEGAQNIAALCAIELRQVAQEPIESVSDWLALQEMTVVNMRSELLGMSVGLAKQPIPLDEVKALAKGKKDFRRAKDGAKVIPNQMFHAFLSQQRQVFEHATGGEKVTVNLRALYSPDDRYILKTDGGDFEIAEIKFVGRIWTEEQKHPVTPHVLRYENITANELITTTASFSIPVGQHTVELTFHRPPEGDMLVQARAVKTVPLEPPET